MKSMAGILLLCITALLLAPSAFAGPLGRGINLGNTLEAPNEGEWDIAAREHMLADYAAVGFTNVRIPVRWDRHTSSSAPYTISASWLRRVEQVVDWGLDQGLYIILNTHHEYWFLQDWSRRERFYAIWEQVSRHFCDKSERLIFEIVNEPAHDSSLSNSQIRQLQRRALDIIRRENPTRDVMITGGHSPHHESGNDIDLPDDPNIIATFHYYLPWQFVGEAQGTWGSGSDRRTVENHMDHVRNWSRQHGNVRIYMGEFGVSVSAHRPSMLTWYETVVQAAVERGFDFGAWEHEGNFEIYHQGSRTWNNEVLNLLLDGAPPPAGPQRPFRPHRIPGTIEAEDYDHGGEGVAYHDEDGENSGDDYRDDGVDIQTSSEGGYNIAWIRDGEWLEYTVEIASSGEYDIDLRMASNRSGGELHIEFDGVDITGSVEVGGTGGWQDWTIIEARGVSLEAGERVMRIAMESDGFNLDWVRLSFVGDAGGKGPLLRRGDCDGNAGVDVTDAIFLLRYLFTEGPRADCEDACDSNDDGVHDISDGIRILLYLFTGGAPIPAPGARNCGEDPTGDDLDCQAPSC